MTKKINKKEISIRSSCAEYLTYVSAIGNSKETVEMRYEDENIWLTQKMMAELYDVGINTINYHIKKIFEDKELVESSVIRKFRITASDGKEYDTNHYSLQMIIAVGFKVDNERADSTKEHMGLTSWKDSPDGKILKSDVVVAKNYLSEDEIYSLERIISAYLDVAEDMANRHIPMTMEDWAKRLDKFLEAADRDILTNAGKITKEIAEEHALTQFEKYRVIQDRLFESDFDRFIKLENAARNISKK